jgi:foldase protein PrsA
MKLNKPNLKSFDFQPIKEKMGSKPIYWVVSGIISLALVLLVVASVGIYKYNWNNGFTKAVTTVIPLPAIKVGGMSASVKEYNERLEALKMFEEKSNKVDFSTDEGKEVLAKIKEKTADFIIKDLIISKYAKENKISVDDKEFEESFNNLLYSNGGKEKFTEVIKNYYNISLDDFKKQQRVNFLNNKVEKMIVADENLNMAAKTQAEQILAEIKGGGDFAALAKKHSFDPSAGNGGDIGFITKGKMIREFEDVAFSLKKGEVSEVFKTTYGYHIVKVTEVGENKVKVSQILIQGKNFSDWLESQKKELKIVNYLK